MFRATPDQKRLKVDCRNRANTQLTASGTLGQSGHGSSGVHGEFLRRHGRLIKSTTVLPPAIGFETHTSGFRRCDRSFSFQSRMTAIPIVVVSKCDELRLQIQSSPKQHLIQTFSADCSDQSLHERMRPGSVWHRLNLPYIQNSKVRLPLMKPVQRVVIGAEIFRQTCTSDGLLEHPAERQAIHDSALDPESDDSACVLVHDNQHPKCLQGHRFTAELSRTCALKRPCSRPFHMSSRRIGRAPFRSALSGRVFGKRGNN